MEINNFQEFVLALSQYWMKLGCIWSQPYDAAMGAGTFHPHTFLKGIGPEPWRSVYVQPCRRPVDGRYGKSPYRFQHYYQLQVVLKPAPSNIVDLFLKSLEHVGIKLKENDISLLEDDWKGPTLGAWGLGWEIRANGQEVTQFTYFQQLGGLDTEVVSGEITYGLERLFMYAKGIKNGMDMPYNNEFTYGDVYYQNEFEFSHFNFKDANVPELFENFERCERNVASLCEKNLVLPAYDYVLQASHMFNLLDARGAISVSERQRYIGRVRDCAKKCAVIYRAERERLGFPMLARLGADARLPLLAQGEKVVEIPSSKKRYEPGILGTAQTVCDVLIELGVEEIPPSFQVSAVSVLTENAKEFLTGLENSFAADPSFLAVLQQTKFNVFVSARRLAVQFHNLPVLEPSKNVEVWGPAERIAKNAQGGLSAAGEGFCKKNGLDANQVVFKEKKDGTFLFAQKQVVGRDLPLLVGAQMKAWCEQIPSPLKMKWLPESISAPFVRPVRWILALVNDYVLSLEMFGLSSGNVTSGQRILTPDFYPVESANAYEKVLTQLGVQPNWETRKSLVFAKAAELAAQAQGRVRVDEDLLAKCAGLSECPEVFVGEIDTKYMKLPAKLVVSVLREHMNYFAVEKQDGKLLPYYIGAAGYACSDKKAMIEGTRNVVVGRLEDGTFYYETDLQTPIRQFQESLSSQLFQADMGTLLDKSNRVGTLAKNIVTALAAARVGWPEVAQADAFAEAALQAGTYCKADLKSGCVQEFPDEMQGLMGGILVSHQRTFGEQSEQIAQAIAEHYEPRGASIALPATALGLVLSLADKLDSLAMFINSGIDIKSSKDPFGLRRSALGVLRILGLDAKSGKCVELSLEAVLNLALKNLELHGSAVKKESLDKLRDFLVGRIKASWRGEFDPGAVEAVAVKFDVLSLQSARSLVEATSKALALSGAGSLLEALVPYRRCRNVTQQLGSGVNPNSLNPELLLIAEEKALFERLLGIEKAAVPLLESQNYNEFLTNIATLGRPLAAFFDTVLVNDPDDSLKQNRLALLVRIRRLYDSVADFSLVQVSANA